MACGGAHHGVTIDAHAGALAVGFHEEPPTLLQTIVEDPGSDTAGAGGEDPAGEPPAGEGGARGHEETGGGTEPGGRRG